MQASYAHLTATISAIALSLCGAVGDTMQAGPSYNSPGFGGRVVDAETRRPVPGTLVLVLWTAPPDTDSLSPLNTLRVFETDTTAEGRFSVPAWEAKSLRAPVGADSPRLIAFAPGRDPVPLERSTLMPPSPAVEIRLPRFAGTPPQRAEQLKELTNLLILAWVSLYGESPPRMLDAVSAEWRALPEAVRRDQPEPRETFMWSVQELRRALEQRKLSQ